MCDDTTTWATAQSDSQQILANTNCDKHSYIGLSKLIVIVSGLEKLQLQYYHENILNWLICDIKVRKLKQTKIDSKQKWLQLQLQNLKQLVVSAQDRCCVSHTPMTTQDNA